MDSSVFFVIYQTIKPPFQNDRKEKVVLLFDLRDIK